MHEWVRIFLSVLKFQKTAERWFSFPSLTQNVTFFNSWDNVWLFQSWISQTSLLGCGHQRVCGLKRSEVISQNFGLPVHALTAPLSGSLHIVVSFVWNLYSSAGLIRFQKNEVGHRGGLAAEHAGWRKGQWRMKSPQRLCKPQICAAVHEHTQYLFWRFTSQEGLSCRFASYEQKQ